MTTKELYTAISKLDEPKVLQVISQLQASELSASDINTAIQAVQDGMSEVGKLFDTGEYFLAELVLAAELCKQVMEVIRPYLKASTAEKIGKVVLGTAKDDIHDIGKDLVKDMLESVGFDVYDLGVDVPYDKFVNTIQEVAPDIVGISGLLTPVIESIKSTIEAIKEAGLRDQIKIIIGGSLMNENVKIRVGADAFTASAAEGIEICRKWVEG